MSHDNNVDQRLVAVTLLICFPQRHVPSKPIEIGEEDTKLLPQPLSLSYTPLPRSLQTRKQQEAPQTTFQVHSCANTRV
jgi:hypothetical protein